MTGVPWNPRQYELFEAQRSRPFFDLISRLTVASPRRIVDLGCGTGALTGELAARFPQSRVIGIDSSAEMLERAGEAVAHHANLAFVQADIADWMPADGDDIVVSNAALQWVPGHRELLRAWFGALGPGAQLAVQMPANTDSPSQLLLRELADEPRWADRLAHLAIVNEQVGTIDDYLRLAFDAGVAVEAWETVYHHVLPGEDAVLEWIAGTRLRPFVAALGDEAPEFVAELRPRLREAFPATAAGTVFPFRRVFFVVTT
jgi:trans-aconitate 2-methyltransferase